MCESTIEMKSPRAAPLGLLLGLRRKMQRETPRARLKREILRFNDELKRKNFPRRAVKARLAEKYGGSRRFLSKSELPPAGLSEQTPVFGCRAAPRAAGGGGDSRDLRSRFVARKGKAGASGGRSSVSEKIAAFRRGWRRLVRPQRVAVVQLATLPGEKAGCQFGLPHPAASGAPTLSGRINLFPLNRSCRGGTYFL